MSTTTIGIKVADRTYYPVLERGSTSRKRLVLTTVKDEQTSVQIDLYENSGTVMDTAQYVGSLMIENINPAQSGEAEVELIVGLDSEQNLGASASEATSGERQSLTLSLESLSGGSVYDIPEFELDNDLDSWDSRDTPDADVDTDAEGFNDDYAAGDIEIGGAYDAVGVEEQEAIAKRKRPLMFALFIVFGVAMVVLIVLLLIKIIDGPSVPPLQAQSDEIQTVQIEDVGDTTGSEATNAAGGGPAPVQKESVGATSDDASYVQPKNATSLGGAWYWIRRGDTLWDLSSSFYQNPRLYAGIAEQNNIADPDVIFAGDRIYIPPR